MQMFPLASSRSPHASPSASQRTASLGALPLLCKLFPRKPPADAHNAANGGGKGQCLDGSPVPMSTKNFVFSCVLCIEFPHKFSREEFGDYESVWKLVAYTAESSPVGSLPLRSPIFFPNVCPPLPNMLPDPSLQNTRVSPFRPFLFPSSWNALLPCSIHLFKSHPFFVLQYQIPETLFLVIPTLGPLPTLNSCSNSCLYSHFGN